MRRMRHLKAREIQGCQLALDSSIAGSLYDAVIGGSLVAADGAVARWEDQSGNARHVTQSGGTQQPLRKVAFINGGDGVLFDGINDVLNVAYAGAGAAGATSLIVAKRTATGAGVKIGFAPQSPSAGFATFAVSFGSGLSSNLAAMWGRRVTTDTRTDKNESAATTSPAVYCGSTDFSTFYAAKNAKLYGTNTWSGTSGPLGTTEFLTVGASVNGSSPMDVSVAAACYWNVRVNPAVAARLSAAQMRKWRIAG